MYGSFKLFFQQTTLFLLKLLRHLVIQSLILLFVWVDVMIHKTFMERTIRTDKAVTSTNRTPPRAGNRPSRKAGRKRRKPGRLGTGKRARQPARGAGLNRTTDW